MRGTNENLEAKEVLAFEGAGECDLCTDGGWLGENVSSMDEVFFDPLSEVVGGGLEGGGDVSDNSGSKPTGTRFRS
jgi:hypothetical protein